MQNPVQDDGTKFVSFPSTLSVHDVSAARSPALENPGLRVYDGGFIAAKASRIFRRKVVREEDLPPVDMNEVLARLGVISLATLTALGINFKNLNLNFDKFGGVGGAGGGPSGGGGGKPGGGSDRGGKPGGGSDRGGKPGGGSDRGGKPGGGGHFKGGKPGGGSDRGGKPGGGGHFRGRKPGPGGNDGGKSDRKLDGGTSSSTNNNDFVIDVGDNNDDEQVLTTTDLTNFDGPNVIEISFQRFKILVIVLALTLITGGITTVVLIIRSRQSAPAQVRSNISRNWIKDVTGTILSSRELLQDSGTAVTTKSMLHEAETIATTDTVSLTPEKTVTPGKLSLELTSEGRKYVLKAKALTDIQTVNPVHDEIGLFYEITSREDGEKHGGKAFDFQFSSKSGQFNKCTITLGLPGVKGLFDASTEIVLGVPLEIQPEFIHNLEEINLHRNPVFWIGQWFDKRKFPQTGFPQTDENLKKFTEAFCDDPLNCWHEDLIKRKEALMLAVHQESDSDLHLFNNKADLKPIFELGFDSQHVTKIHDHTEPSSLQKDDLKPDSRDITNWALDWIKQRKLMIDSEKKHVGTWHQVLFMNIGDTKKKPSKPSTMSTYRNLQKSLTKIKKDLIKQGENLSNHTLIIINMHSIEHAECPMVVPLDKIIEDLRAYYGKVCCVHWPSGSDLELAAREVHQEVKTECGGWLHKRYQPL